MSENNVRGSLGPNPSTSEDFSSAVFKVGGGADYTSARLVDIEITAPNATEYSLHTNLSDCQSNPNWQPISNNVSTSIADLNSLNNFYLKLRNTSGESDCIQSSITHDEIPPAAPTNISFVEPVGGRTSTELPIINFADLVGDGTGSGVIAYEVKGVSGEWVPIVPGVVTSMLPVGVINPTGPTILFLRSVDKAGNHSPAIALPPISATGSSRPILDYPSYTAVKDIYTTLAGVDFDSDGDIDIVFLSDDNQLYWLDNDGSANFTERATGLSMSSFPIIKDLDGDGDLDLLESDLGSVWRNENNQFNSQSFVNNLTFTGHSSHSVMDVDFDNDLDIFIFDSSTKEMWLIENLGQLKFSARKLFTDSDFTSFGYYSKIDDFDGDGNIDLLQERSADLYIYSNLLNNGGANSSTGAYGGAYRQLLSDLEGDGDLDIIIYTNFTSLISILKNDGANNFTEFSLTHGLDYIQVLVKKDIDQDGDDDFYAAGLNNNKLVWFENLGNGTLTEHDITPPGRGPSEIVCLDFDGDGDLDFTFNDTLSSYTPYLLENNGSQVFTESMVLVDSGAYYQIDFNGDGLLDGFEADYDLGNIKLNLGNGTDTMTSSLLPKPDGRPEKIFRNHVADLDGDGDEDIIYIGSPSGDIYWRENNGSGQFANVYVIDSTLTSIGFQSDFETADLNGDGNTDILFRSDEFGNNIYWYENDGNSPPSFTKRTLTNEYWMKGPISLLDFDGDLDMDLVGTYSSSISYYQNNGSGVFTRVHLYTETFGAQHVVAGDLDGDTDIDVVYTKTTASSGVFALINNLPGPPGYTQKTLFTQTVSFLDDFIFLFDPDQDGDLDIFNNSSFNSSHVLLNDGANNYNPSFQQVVYQPTDIEEYDVDNDGYLDLVVYNDPFAELFVYFNNQDGTFTKSPIGISLQNQSGNLSLIDVDNDGRMEVLASSDKDATSLYIFEFVNP